ncbi:MAG: biopolymer transporter ExbD [Longimicrobiales bacterium]|nr:biopolymer transporter ExbD [Longimicrobiales bacterium]
MSSLGSHRRGGRGRDRGDLPLNAEINVTSLVDVAFTLLVIFIITAPILQGGIEVSLPRADVPPLTSQESPFFITVMRDGQIMMEETPVTVDQLESSLPQLLSTGEIQRVFIRADSLAPWGPVLKTMAISVNAGVDWSVVGEPWTGDR